MDTQLATTGTEIGLLLNRLEAQLAEAFAICSHLAVASATFGSTAGVTPRIAQPVVQELGGATVIGPLMVGLDKPVQIVSLGATDNDLVRMAALAGYQIGG